jgi:hypothetical protein
MAEAMSFCAQLLISDKARGSRGLLLSLQCCAAGFLKLGFSSKETCRPVADFAMGVFVAQESAESDTSQESSCLKVDMSSQQIAWTLRVNQSRTLKDSSAFVR